MSKSSHKRTEIDLILEDKILIQCTRQVLEEDNLNILTQLLKEEPDWDLLLEKSGWQRLSPLLSHHLLSSELHSLVPNVCQKKLKNILFVSLSRNMILQNELSSILKKLNEENIPTIVLKGAALLGNLYNDISLRPMSDLDILVKSENLGRAQAIALNRGFIVGEEDLDAKDVASVTLHHLPHLINTKKGIILEIHQQLVDSDEPYDFTLNDFWTRAMPLSVLGVNTLTFSWEDMLIHLSIKFLLDRRFSSTASLGQLCDISEIIKHCGNDFDWDLLVKTAQDNQFTDGLHCVLYACEQLLGTTAPPSVTQKLRPPDFNPGLTNLFFLRRVFECKPWLVHDLISSQESYAASKTIKSIFKRLFHVPKEIKEQNKVRVLKFYKTRMGEILPRIGKSIIKPSRLREDLLLDKWLHDMDSSNSHSEVRRWR